MNPLNSGFEYWSNINVFTNNVFTDGPATGLSPSPPIDTFYLLTESSDFILAEDGDFIEVEHT